ncbi:bifunctional UDP-N-acetylglucosamine diphosphorylase/glucosamine-1-phosphate N-acetyltransferase GlmU [Simiduia sp. 21SJ11W-1]|uniref:bifunctional UDP-N-acetylglucosamine diphosphorylase/glucosamine-1-phosphate N-acetyltransferase GlmU n=1 Tax=Simiduia sp. 21SJ11W-1 TaxID=2909669 RepID=UPI0020A0259E|nr:bifunctional UDP-N-acetylglucosamine diphosphorylase/glucosamine-1-phosphate N-acetyltransferase GlmU [Simiduia sp. 21SJ11W-1]UTA47953.1 bifunctional UDP-N-acetylglucosamine diphosphorylase/glucosamine-1-phosphate N-acetyltransferase GlmU [Simiduia sp. 21SJ11W-1]
MLDIVVLAAGKGTRMKSDLPKVLHPIAGKPLLQHVLDTSQKLGESELIVVVGHGAESVKTRVAAPKLKFVDQTEQLGTGHAVQQTLTHLRDDAVVLILYGDVPLIAADTLQSMVDQVTHFDMALLTVLLADPTGYGRILRNAENHIVAIVEQKDANPAQLAIQEVNTGVMAVKGALLKRWLPELSNDNAQGEYYLTDIIALASRDGITVKGIHPASELEVLGVNNRRQQAELERYYQKTNADQLMEAGVTLLDPYRFDVRGEFQCGHDVIIDVNCVFEGTVSLGNNVVIEPNCILRNVTLGDNVLVKANSHLEDTRVENNCEIGPYARLRPGTVLKDNAKIGNFVETKKTTVGVGSKINHLSYVGDASLGEGVNIGAGTITCNYDGVNKFKTTIGNRVFVGSNTALVAPVTLADDATIGAGSIITKDVEAQELAIARAKQRNITGWAKPTKK